jgi:undecaprenyl-phosphate 4-deoxy-4-formamido-L-arabinose transferase
MQTPRLVNDSEEETLSVVVPVFNSEEILPQLIERLEKNLSLLSDEYEIILVNDGSRDKSWSVISELSQKHNRIRGINLMRNYGQHNALLCGIRAAKNKIIITIDDDLQHPPEEIEKLLAKLNEGYDVVYGVPEKDSHTIWRNIASQLTKIVLQNAMGAETARRMSAFRIFRSHLREAFENFEGSYISIDVLLTWGTTKFTYIFVAHQPRKIGQSNYTLRKLISHAFNMITGFSTLPLKLASFIGFFFTLFGFGILVYVIGRYFLFGNPVPGFPFLAASIAIFSGAQLFTLGIIGEYLARIYTRTMNRPSYQILESCQSNDANE